MITDSAEQKRYILTAAGNSLLMFFAVLCAFGALISAFSFPVYLWRASLSWLIVCAILSAVALRYQYRGILISLIPAFALFLWLHEEIIEGARWLIFTLTDYYSNWLVIAVFFPESAYFEGDPTIFFIAAGIFMAILLSIAICIHRSAFMTALFTIPVVMLTFVVVSEYQPAFIYIFGLLSVMLTILLTNALVLDDFRKRGTMTIAALLATVTFLGIAYFVNPPDRFDRSVHNVVVARYFNAIATRMGNLWERVPSPGHGIGWPPGAAGGMWAFNTRYVDIADAGSTTLTDRSLLEVEVTSPGVYYLRGYSMQHFDGRRWSVNSSANTSNYRQDEFSRNFPARISMYHSAFQGEPPPLVGINITRTGDITNINYIPYFIMSPVMEHRPEVFEHTFYTALSERVGELSRYDITFIHIRESVHRIHEEVLAELIQRPQIGTMPDLEPYMQIDGNIAEALRAIALDAGISPNAQRTDIVDAVARYVRSAATYSLSPGVVPEGEDFVLYFLQYMESGFCIHFATAATLMLRSLGVPARFTTGYVFTVPRGYEGETITLTDHNAHAWVEVFYDDVGWLYLEVTPGGIGSVIPSPLPHSPGEIPDNIPFPTPTPDTSHMMGPDDFPMMNGTVNGMINGTPDLSAGDQAGGEGGIATAMGVYPWLFNLIIGISIIVISIVAILLRRHIVLKYRKKRFEQSDANAAVISMWQFIEKIARREAIPPTDIEELALKARFSTHKINPEERAQVKTYAKRLAEEIYRSKGDYAKLWLKYALVMR